MIGIFGEKAHPILGTMPNMTEFWERNAEISAALDRHKSQKYTDDAQRMRDMYLFANEYIKVVNALGCIPIAKGVEVNLPVVQDDDDGMFDINMCSFDDSF